MSMHRSRLIRRLMMESVIALSAIGAVGMLPGMPVAAFEPVAPWQLAQGSLYSSSPGRFEIAFPTPPDVTTEDDDIEGDPVEVHIFETSSSNSQYMVAYSDLPTTFLSQGSEVVLNHLRDSFEDINPEVLKAVEVNVQLGGHPGRRYRYSHDEGTIDMRFYLVNERAYLLFAIDDNETDVDRFISSFALL
ncbi:hypothetical protein Lepto7375DRAFT_4956 [Leptolyngbya sp. PCC 7375]|nr:hypothetical protein Lepto7375DRAFT_4956 [Leptolyngbya sp. PCC 7375]